MATALSIKSLEELCLTHVAMTLEQYSTDSLSLLPKGFRVQLLHKIPIIDICRLEDTKFVIEIDMESVWKQIVVDLEYVRRRHIIDVDDVNKVTIGDVAPSSIEGSWKHYFFSAFIDFIVRGKRPYGYFNYSFGQDDQVVGFHPVDHINYLVAIKWEDSTARKPSGAEYLLPSSSKEEFQLHLARHRLRHDDGSLPCLQLPGKAYHEACRAKQLVPPRYTKFFSEGSCYLPDSTALKLITEKCHFRPKEMCIDLLTLFLVVPTFLEEGEDIVWFKKLVKNVETLKIITGRDCSNTYVTIPSKIVQLIVQQEEPKLTSVTVNFSDSRSLKFEDVLNSLTPVLTSSYSGLTELNIDVDARQFPNLDSLVAIVEHHCSLHTVSVKCRHPSRAELNMSMQLMKPWLKVCFIKPSLCHFKLSLSPMPTNIMMDILAMFLSTPRSQEQTLTFSAMDIGSTSAQVTSLSDITLERQVFEDSILQLKSLEFCQCSFGPSFMNSLLNLPSLKVKQMSTKEHFYAGNKQNTLQFASHPRVKLESLNLTGARMDGSEDFDAILSKNSLKIVQFVNYHGIDIVALRESATRHGFKVVRSKTLTSVDILLLKLKIVCDHV